MSPRATSTHPLNTSRDGESTIFVGKPFFWVLTEYLISVYPGWMTYKRFPQDSCLVGIPPLSFCPTIKPQTIKPLSDAQGFPSVSPFCLSLLKSLQPSTAAPQFPQSSHNVSSVSNCVTVFQMHNCFQLLLFLLPVLSALVQMLFNWTIDPSTFLGGEVIKRVFSLTKGKSAFQWV